MRCKLNMYTIFSYIEERSSIIKYLLNKPIVDIIVY